VGRGLGIVLGRLVVREQNHELRLRVNASIGVLATRRGDYVEGELVLAHPDTSTKLESSAKDSRFFLQRGARGPSGVGRLRRQNETIGS
jgi:hypothetical protein